MLNLAEGTKRCSICNNDNDHCFYIIFSRKHNISESDENIGCYYCLKNGEFEFWHDSEFGLLDENGLTKMYNHHIDNPPKLSEEF